MSTSLKGQIYRWEFLKVCHHLDKFGEPRHYNSEDTVFFICHATSDLKGYVNLLVESPYGDSPISHVQCK